MKTSNKDKITISLNGEISLRDFRSLLNDIIVDEIASHPQLSESMKSFGLELASTVSIPVDSEITTEKKQCVKDSILSSTITKAGIGASAAIMSMALLKKTPTIIRALGGLTGGMLAGVALQRIDKPESYFKERQLILTTPEKVEEQIDKLISSLVFMDKFNMKSESKKKDNLTFTLEELNEINQKSEYDGQSVSMSFGDNYSNIIKWLQNIYLETESYGEECAKSIRRKIERILDSVYCTTVHYDGKNGAIFEFNDDSTITEALELFPAIIAHSGKVYPGLVSKPFKN